MSRGLLSRPKGRQGSCEFQPARWRCFRRNDQVDPQFGATHDRATVAGLIGVQPSDINDEWPIQTVSTGHSIRDRSAEAPEYSPVAATECGKGPRVFRRGEQPDRLLLHHSRHGRPEGDNSFARFVRDGRGFGYRFCFRMHHLVDGSPRRRTARSGRPQPARRGNEAAESHLYARWQERRQGHERAGRRPRRRNRGRRIFAVARFPLLLASVALSVSEPPLRLVAPQTSFAV